MDSQPIQFCGANPVLQSRECLAPTPRTARHRSVRVPLELISPTLDRLSEAERISPDVVPLNNKSDGKGHQAVNPLEYMLHL